jgi:FAD/FMN-containing dehydrogenase
VPHGEYQRHGEGETIVTTNDTALGRDLRRTVRGPVLIPGEEGFEQARQSWDRSVDQRVRAVVEAEDAADAAAVVGYTRLAGLSVATQASGHGATGALSDSILLRTRRMREVEIRPEQRLARVEAGAAWGEVLAPASKHGLTALAGSSPVVTTTGFTLGGGLSWFGRRYGLAANSVRAFDTIDACGAHARITAESDPELFWALRGGGGDFALVTAMELELYPAPQLYGGRIIWPAARATEVLAAFQEITAQAPDELSVWFSLMQFPPFPELPEPLRGLSAVVIDTAFLGGAGEGRALLSRFDGIAGQILDTRAPLTVAELGTICNEPTEPMPVLYRGELLNRLDEAAGPVLAAAAQGSVAPLAFLQVRHLGGAFARPAEGGGACGHFAEAYLVGMLGVPDSPGTAGAIKERQASLVRALTPYTSGRKPFNFLGHEETSSVAFPGGTLARLRDIKRSRDPEGVFRSNYPVFG